MAVGKKIEVLRRGAASLLALAMAFGAVPMIATAEEAIDDSGLEVIEEVADDEAMLDVSDEFVLTDEGAALVEELGVDEEQDVAAEPEAGAAEATEAEEIELAPMDEDVLESQVTYTPITLNNSWVSGYLDEGAVINYRFTLKKAGRLRIEFQNWSTNSYMYLGLYNESFTTRYFNEQCQHYNPGTLSNDAYISAGTYILRVVGNSDSSHGDYSIRGKYTAAKAAERDNGTFDSALTIKEGATTYATFTRNGLDHHYYKFVLSKSGTVRINIQQVEQGWDNPTSFGI